MLAVLVAFMVLIVLGFGLAAAYGVVRALRPETARARSGAVVKMRNG
jgi:hypothetical protein